MTIKHLCDLNFLKFVYDYKKDNFPIIFDPTLSEGQKKGDYGIVSANSFVRLFARPSVRSSGQKFTDAETMKKCLFSLTYRG